MLSEQINRDIKRQITLGFQFRTQAGLLRSFAAFAQAQGHEFVHSQRVIDWAGQAPSAAQRRNRLLNVRRFALTAQAEDHRHQVPPSGVFGHTDFERSTPYIFEPKEIAALMRAAAQLTPKGSLRPATFMTLFGLLSATGLRSSEALALTIEDITDDGLLVRETKFHKSRLVPLHDSVREALARYLERRLTVTTTHRAVFTALTGSALKYSTVVTVFLALLRSLGLHPGPGQRGPRMHDLRHTFAVRSLEQCGGESQAIKRHMLALSTYLGHAHISDTYWYLHATPQLMRHIAQDAEHHHHRGEQS